MTQLPILPYSVIRNRFKPGDALFYPRLSAPWPLRNIGGYLSNLGIAGVQLLGADHRRHNQCIHVETLLPMTIANLDRWLALGFTNKRNAAGGSLDINPASYRLERYPEHVLWAPIKDELRSGLTAEAIMGIVERDFTEEYGIADLVFAESRLLVGNAACKPVCSSWLAKLYMETNVMSNIEYRYEKGLMHRRTLNPANVSPKDFPQSYGHIIDWSRAAHIAKGA